MGIFPCKDKITTKVSTTKYKHITSIKSDVNHYHIMSYVCEHYLYEYILYHS